MKAICSALFLSLFTLFSGAAFAATEDECDIDEAMRKQRIAMDRRVSDVYRMPEEAMDNAPHVKDGACLPILDQLGGLIKLRVPGFGDLLGGIWSKIKQMACNMANSTIEQIANSARVSVSDPLGVVGGSIGVGTDGSGGVERETYDFGKVIDGAVEGAANQVGNKVHQEVSGDLNKIPSGATDRTPRVEQTINNGVQDAIRGL